MNTYINIIYQRPISLVLLLFFSSSEFKIYVHYIMKIIIILLFLWVLLDRFYPIEPYITKEEEGELEKWFDLATELKTEISCIENFS